MVEQIDFIKVVVKKDLYPKLHELLAAIPKRARAEKLKQLAALGEMIERGAFTTTENKSHLRTNPVELEQKLETNQDREENHGFEGDINIGNIEVDGDDFSDFVN